MIAKNFGSSPSDFLNLPAQQLYIFPDGTAPSHTTPDVSHLYWLAAPSDDAQAPENPQGQVPSPFIFTFSQVNATQHSGGTSKIADSSTFKAANTIAVAEVTVEPGAMRYVTRHFLKSHIEPDNPLGNFTCVRFSRRCIDLIFFVVAPHTRRVDILPVRSIQCSL